MPQIDESKKLSAGGGVDGERIEVLGLPLANARDFVQDSLIPKSSGMMFAVYWLLDRLAAEEKG